MRKIIVLVLVFFCCTGVAAAKAPDDIIREKIIQESIASYPGSCPCPYNLARNGSHCGRRSAYTRPGGYAPLCYPADVTDAMVADYKKQHKNSE